MIWEFGDFFQPNWVHIAYRKDTPAKQCLKAYKEDGKTKYSMM